MGAACGKSTRVSHTTKRPWTEARYRVVVTTGRKAGAGTDAHVFLRLHGEKIDGQEHELTRPARNKHLFERGAVDVFFVHDVALGDLRSISVRSDGAGRNADWFVHSVTVTDMILFEEWAFPVEAWVRKSEPANTVPHHTHRAAAESSLASFARVLPSLKTGDVVVMVSGRVGTHVGAGGDGNTVYTHAGVVVLDATTGKARLYEACENEDGTFDIESDDVWAGVHHFDLAERVASFNGDVYHLPLKKELGAGEVDALHAYCAQAHYERAPFTVKQHISNTAVARLLKGMGMPVRPTRVNAAPLVLRALGAAGVLHAPADAAEWSSAWGDACVSDVVAAGVFGDMHTLVEGRTEQPVPASVLDGLDTGDVLLFSCTHAFGKIVQVLAQSRWDHVAVVLKRDGELYLFEATGVGVKVYDVERRLRSHRFKTIALRRLECKRSASQRVAVDALVSELEDKPYEANRAELVKSLMQANKKENLDTVFCSELVAEVLQRLGVLSEREHSNNYAPHHFASDSDDSLALTGGAILHPELFLKH